MDTDSGVVLDISLRAWEPVVPEIEQAFGPELHRRLNPDWKAEKRDEIAAFSGNAKKYHAWVAESERKAVGFVAIELHRRKQVGEIYLLAVDPDYQCRGIGTALTRFALAWMKDAGMVAAMVETGFDSGHAPARRTYEKAGCVPVPAARYFKEL